MIPAMLPFPPRRVVAATVFSVLASGIAAGSVWLAYFWRILPYAIELGSLGFGLVFLFGASTLISAVFGAPTAYFLRNRGRLAWAQMALWGAITGAALTVPFVLLIGGSPTDLWLCVLSAAAGVAGATAYVAMDRLVYPADVVHNEPP